MPNFSVQRVGKQGKWHNSQGRPSGVSNGATTNGGSSCHPNCRLAADGETVGYHAIWEKQHVWKLHKCCNGGHHVGVQSHIAKEETSVLVKGFNKSYHNKETMLFTIDPYYGNLSKNP